MFGFIHVVRGEDQGHAVTFEAPEAVPQEVAGLRIQTRGGLVEQEDLGFVDEGAGDGEAAFHPSRQRFDPGVGSFGELSELEQLVGALAHHRSGDVEVPTVDVEVVAYGQLVVERVELGDDAEPSPDLGSVTASVEPEDGQLAFGGG